MDPSSEESFRLVVDRFSREDDVQACSRFKPLIFWMPEPMALPE
jgi:hypothetical protein